MTTCRFQRALADSLGTLSLAAFHYDWELVVEVDGDIQRQLGSLETAATAESTVPKRAETSACQRPRYEPKTFDLPGELYRIIGVDLTNVPGISASTAQTILCEIGTDVSISSRSKDAEPIRAKKSLRKLETRAAETSRLGTRRAFLPTPLVAEKLLEGSWLSLCARLEELLRTFLGSGDQICRLQAGFHRNTAVVLNYSDGSGRQISCESKKANHLS